MAKLKLKGIREHRGGWEVRWKGSDGKLRHRRFPLATSVADLKDFRDKEMARVTLAAPTVVRGTFEDERDRFLGTIKTGTRRHKDFTEKLAAWESHLKGLRLNAIETPQVNRVLMDWQSEGKSNATLMRLRSALMSLFNNRAPDLAVNPVARAMSFKIPKARARAIDLGQLAAIFAKAPECQTKARQMMVFYFGMRPSEIMRLQPRDLMLDGAAPHVFVRSQDENPEDSEGKGTNDRIVPIVSEAQMQVARMFVKWDSFGPYSTSAARTSFLRWARAAGITDDTLIEGQTRLGRNRYRLRPYDQRHTFATEMRKVDGVDLADVAAALGHRSLKTSERYAPRQDAKVAAGLAKSAIHSVPVNLMQDIAKLSAEAKAALLAQLQAG
jgi:integrase